MSFILPKRHLLEERVKTPPVFNSELILFNLSLELREKAIAPLTPRGTLDKSAVSQPEDISRVYKIAAQIELQYEGKLSPHAVGCVARAFRYAGGEEHVPWLIRQVWSADLDTIDGLIKALQSIGGPEASWALLDFAGVLGPVSCRRAAIFGILDLATGGWDTYGMGPGRAKFPHWVRERLEKFQDEDLSHVIESALTALD